jgi:predicted ferric reductase
LLGILGVVAILMHPISFLYVYSAKFNSLFTFVFSSSLGIALSLGKIALLLFILVWISSAVLRSRLPYKYFKVIHIATYPIVILSFIHAYIIGSYVNGNSVIRYWFISLSALVFIAIIYRIISVLFLQKTYSIVEKAEIGDGVNLYTLKPEGKSVDVKPGQFIYLSIDGDLFSHPFTVLSVNLGGEIQICIKTFGNFTEKLSKCVLNTKVKISEPYGVFLQRSESDRIICIAGGIGITPFAYFVQKGVGKNVSLHYFAKDKQSAYFRDRLEVALNDKYKEHFSEEAKVSARSVVESMTSEDINNAEFYLCGPPPLIKDMISELKIKGVNHKKIFTEQFSF